MPLFVDAIVFAVTVVPFFGPVLLDLVVVVVELAPVLALSQACAQISLPLVAPFFFLADFVLLAPFFLPFFLGVLVFAPFFAIGFLNITAI